MPHKITLVIRFLRKRNRAITPVELRVESRTAQPLPVPAVTGSFMIDEPFFEDLCPALPVDVAAPTRQEARNGVTPEMVDPPFLP